MAQVLGNMLNTGACEQGTLLSGGFSPTNGDTVTLGADTYQFSLNTPPTPAKKTSTGIAFNDVNPDTITNDANDFVDMGFKDGQTITVTGSVSNNGTYKIATVTQGTITLTGGGALVNEVAGANVTILQVTTNVCVYK